MGHFLEQIYILDKLIRLLFLHVCVCLHMCMVTPVYVCKYILLHKKEMHELDKNNSNTNNIFHGNYSDFAL